MAPPIETKKPQQLPKDSGALCNGDAVPAPLATEATEAAKLNLEMSNELLKKQIEELKSELVYTAYISLDSLTCSTGEKDQQETSKPSRD